MSNKRQASQYQEVEIKTSTPTELVVLLYDASLANLQEARNYIREGSIADRVRCLNKVMAILTELQATLNFEAGGEIAMALDQLYAYIKDRVFQANLHQDPEPLSEVSKLMDGLREAWVEVARSERHARATESTAQSKSLAMSLPKLDSAVNTQTEGVNITG